MNTTAAPLPSRSLMTRLSGMMFLQYAIWGAWLPFLWSFLSGHRGMNGTEIGDMFAIGAVGAIVGPFIAGQVADRYFSTEKFLAASHLVGALLIWQLATIETYTGFLVFSGLYGLVYAPTLSLTNSLAFHHLPDRDRDFGRVRLWGTLGWIVVGLLMGHWLANVHAADPVAGKADAFRLSAILGAGMAVYCLFLPHTPPSEGEQRSATFAAMGAVRRNPLATLFLLAIPVSCIHQFYFVHTEAFLGEKQAEAPAFFQTLFGLGGGGLMTIGQMAELFVIGAIPLVAKTVSRKHLLAVGLVAYALRMALFAHVDALPLPTMATLVIGIGLHGLCFGCFIFVAFMVVDEESGADIRASAQSLFNLVIIGCGVIVGSKIAGWVSDWAKEGDVQDYEKLFGVPMWGALACLVALLVFYPAGRASEG
ncbi:MAG: MFS transporter [Planctomycetota bacterium]|jgi:nucleoside transporter|nr:MFS transporter [Planctomycetota bacterium]MDP6989303.1 MFS transporter [Planctomycetota bacterium]